MHADHVLDDEATMRIHTSRPRPAAPIAVDRSPVPVYVPHTIDTTPPEAILRPSTRPRYDTSPPTSPPEDPLTAALGAIIESLNKPEPTTGERIAAWFKSPANWIVMLAALWGLASGFVQIRDQWVETVSFRETAIRTHEDIAASIAALRDEVIEMRGRDMGRRDD